MMGAMGSEKEVPWTLPVLHDLLRSDKLFQEAAENGTLRNCPGVPDCRHGAVAHLHYGFADGRRVLVYAAGKRLPRGRGLRWGMMRQVSELDGQPYCGEELLPHATLPDSSPAPILCTSELHSRYSPHSNDELKTTWRWQDKHGNWLSAPAVEFP